MKTMKQIKLMAALLALLFVVACGDDNGGTEVTDPVAPLISTPTDGSAIVVTEANLTSNLEITWAAADFGAEVAVNYAVQMDAEGGDFSSPVVLESGVNGTSITLTNTALNSAIISDLGMEGNAEALVDIRVVASSQGFEDLVSGVVGMSVTTFLPDQTTAAVVTLSTSTIAVTAESLSDKLTITWSPAVVGSGDTIIYSVQLALAGEGVDAAKTVGLTGGVEYTLSHEALNLYLDQDFGQDPETEVAVEVFITATSGTEFITSEAAAVAVTTLTSQYYGDVMYMTGSFTDPGWEPWNNAVVLKPLDVDGTTVYEGFAYFNAAHEVKFTDQAGWDGTNYAFASEGVLTTEGTDNIPVAAGHYRVVVDPTNLTYSFTEVQWGIIGTATPGSWDASTAMTYNEENNSWEITEDLINGALKFRANDGWDINLGPRDSFTKRGALVHTDGAIDFGVGSDGNYTVRISLDTSVSPYVWNFEIIRNQ